MAELMRTLRERWKLLKVDSFQAAGKDSRVKRSVRTTTPTAYGLDDVIYGDTGYMT